MSIGTVCGRFFEINKEASKSFRTRLNLESEVPFWDRFDDLVADYARSLGDKATVADLGGGRSCRYAHRIPRDRGVRIVAVDISDDELSANQDVDECRVADVSHRLPFQDGEVDLLVSRALLEHVDGVPHAVNEMGRVLRPGGTALHFIPCRNSLFGLAARLLPFGPLKRLLHFVRPETRGVVEFDIHYDSCVPGIMRKLFLASGFSEVEVSICWSQSGYFLPIFPLYLPVAAYQWMAKTLRLESLAAYMIVRATR
jgi:ubiquinone/menaquinone biosynthesis C-methylase UbiE